MPNSSSPNRPQFFPQEAANTCAVACLRMVLSAYGLSVSESELAKETKTNEFGTELGELVSTAIRLGFDAQANSITHRSLAPGSVSDCLSRRSHFGPKLFHARRSGGRGG